MVNTYPPTVSACGISTNESSQAATDFSPSQHTTMSYRLPTTPPKQIANAKMIPQPKLSCQEETTAVQACTSFQHFSQLPPGLREEVYRHYFDMVALAGSTDQPQDKHAAALLLTCRQIYSEAHPIMFKKATLTLHVSRKYATQPVVKFADYLIKQDTVIEDVCSTPSQTLHRFNAVTLIIDRPLEEHATQHWEHMRPIFDITVCYLKSNPHINQYFTIRLNLVNLDAILCKSSHPAVAVCEAALREHTCPRSKSSKRPRQSKHQRAEIFRMLERVDQPNVRDWICVIGIFMIMISHAQDCGRVLRWECGDKVKDVAAAKNMMEVCEMAQEVAGDADTWFVSEGLARMPK